MTSLIECNNLSKEYLQGTEQVKVLEQISFKVKAQDSIAIVGASGSGKSTLLSLIGGLDSPSSGSVSIDGCDLSTCSETQLSQLRNLKIGFVYQFHHLLREFSALENVAMPLLIRGVKAQHAYTQAQEMLTMVDLAHRVSHKPAALSGGERQRVAIARALVAKPAYVLMDEPTGNLDHHTASHIHKLIAKLNQLYHTAFIVVTHDLEFAHTMGKVLQLQDSKLSAPE